MNNIFLEKSENTPQVTLDKVQHLIEFEGKSYPENTFAFYRPITEWLKSYFKTSNYQEENITINFKFTYFNSATTQIIFEILDIISEAEANNLNIFWFYDKENSNGREDYEDYSEEFPQLNIQAKVT